MRDTGTHDKGRNDGANETTSIQRNKRHTDYRPHRPRRPRPRPRCRCFSVETQER